jgi:hypothetical protein
MKQAGYRPYQAERTAEKLTRRTVGALVALAQQSKTELIHIDPVFVFQNNSKKL